jgi:hypothetical protein
MLLAYLKTVVSHLRGKVSAPPPKRKGRFLSEDEIVEDLVAKIVADEVAMQRWTDPVSWKFPCINPALNDFKEEPEHSGCMLWISREIRNYYGLWDPENPYTKIDDCLIEDGVITDPLFPDNLSGRVVDRVKEILINKTREKVDNSGCAYPVVGCRCLERMGMDFYFLPAGVCLYRDDR